MGNISITLPSIGQPNSTEDVDVRNSLQTIQTVINGNIDSTNAPSLVAQNDLKPWLELGCAYGGGQGNNTFLMYPGGNGSNGTIAGTAGSAVGAVRFEPTLLYSGSRTLKVYISGWIRTSVTSTGLASVAMFMAPATLGSLSNSSVATISAPIAGASLSFTPVTTNATLGPLTADFTAPSAGFYAFCIQLNQLAAGSYLDCHLQVFLHTV